MLRNRAFYGLLLCGLTLIYIFTNTYYTLTLLGLCIFLPLLSLTLMLFSRRGLKLLLSLPGTAEKESAELTYKLENTSIFPVARVTFLVGMENQMTGGEKKRKVSATVGGRKTVTARLFMTDSKVGTVIVSTKKIRVYDAFGLFAFKKEDLKDQAAVIYPDMREVMVYMEKPIETTGDGTRYSAERPGPDVSEIFALREYVPGDEVRKIHWKLSSKMDKLMFRDFSLPLNYSVFLLVELTQDKETVIDAVIELSLSLSKALLQNGINHNLAWYNTAGGMFYVRELDHFEDLEIAAAQVLSAYPGKKIGEALSYYAASSYRSRKSTLLYVTSALDVDEIAELEAAQTMKTVYVYEQEGGNPQSSPEQAVQLTAVSVKQVTEGIPEIMV